MLLLQGEQKGQEMTPEQKAAFHEAVIDALVRSGDPVRTGDTTYNWVDCYGREDLRGHLAECGLDYGLCSWAASRWSEFLDTFHGFEDHTGTGAVVSCRCGQVQGRAWRYQGGYAELIRAITED